MNIKLKTLVIFSAIVMSLTGCSKNNVEEKVENVTEKVESDVTNPQGNYRDSDGFIEDNEDENNLENDVENMIEDSSSVQTMAQVNADELKSMDNTKQGWGQGKNKNENNQPVDAINFKEKYGKYNAFFIGNTDEKKIYLTFDEGY